MSDKEKKGVNLRKDGNNGIAKKGVNLRKESQQQEENPYFFQGSSTPEQEKDQEVFLWAIKNYSLWVLIILLLTVLLEKVLN